MLTLDATNKALVGGLASSCLASGGTPPYVYSISSNESGGTIDASGNYVAGYVIGRDVITVMDATHATATTNIMVGCPLKLICDIIQKELSLVDGQVYLYNQKFNIPKDTELYVAVGVVSSKPFGNSISYDSTGKSVQSLNVRDTVSIDIMSRGTSALLRKEEVIMALNSSYAIKQQELNSFNISRIPTQMNNLSSLEGNAIPFRFNININVQYFVNKTKSSEYFDNGLGQDVITNE